MKKAKGYSDVLKELEETLARMNRGEIPIDELERPSSRLHGRSATARKAQGHRGRNRKGLKRIEGAPKLFKGLAKISALENQVSILSG